MELQQGETGFFLFKKYRTKIRSKRWIRKELFLNHLESLIKLKISETQFLRKLNVIKGKKMCSFKAKPTIK